MSISSAGIGTGIDAESIIAKLVSLERQPITRIDSKLKSSNDQISAYGRILAATEKLRTAAGKLDSSYDFQAFSATLADEDYATATASSLANSGSYSLHVEQLAQANKLQSAAGPSVAAGDLTISLGTLSGGGTIYTAASSVTINFTGSTLEDLRAAINDADAGVTATIVNGDSGQRLILTSKETGAASTIKLEGTSGLNGAFDYDPTSPTASFTETAAAQDAEAYFDGILVTSASNTIEDAVSGVDVTLKQTHTQGDLSDVTTLTVGPDSETMTGYAEDFVTAWNELNSLFKSLTAYDATNKKAATLTGDQTVRSIETQLRDTLFSSPSGASSAYPRLSDLGITLNQDGSLTLDSSKFGEALEDGFADVTSTITAFGADFKTLTDSLVDSAGPIETKTDALDAMVELLEDRREALELQVAAVEKRYRAQFTALDALVGSLQTQSAYLSQQLALLAQ